MSRGNTVITLLLCAFFLAFPITSSAVDNVSIGVLEEGYIPPGYQHALRNGVRILFEKSDTGWNSICESKSENRNDDCRFGRANDLVDWYVQYAGKQLGIIQTNGWLDSNFYSEMGLLKITTDVVPTLGERNILFSGWMGIPVHRPLVVTTQAPYKPLHRWESIKAKSQDVELVWPAFHGGLPKVEVCLTDSQGESTGVEYRATSKKDMVLASVLKSNDGNRLFHAIVNREVFKDCDGPFDSPVDLWLYQPLNGKPTVIPGQSNSSIALLDFGDFGGDQSDLAIFSLSGYDEGGYVLFYDHFQKQVRFTWLYH